MQVAVSIDRAKYNVFRWRSELTVSKKLALALGVACIVGLLAQVRVAGPWSPVPITGQTFAVMLAGVMLGRRWGGVSMAIYGGLGLAGVPWFAGWTSGLGSTGGYIIGFVFAALFMGYFTDRYVRSRGFFSMLGLMMFANFVLIYVPGLIWLKMWLGTVSGMSVDFVALLGLGALPFVAGDIIKAVAAAGIARGVTTKRAYGNEADAHKWASQRLP